jgi:2Fe-2S ferredoxin
MPRITFKNTNQSFEVVAGTSVLDCAIDQNIALNHDCGGNCACTTCHIFVEDGAQNFEPMGEDERGLLEVNDKLDQNSRLGCQARIKTGSVTVRIPE